MKRLGCIPLKYVFIKIDGRLVSLWLALVGVFAICSFYLSVSIDNCLHCKKYNIQNWPYELGKIEMKF
jgi:hypothetical protein